MPRRFYFFLLAVVLILIFFYQNTIIDASTNIRNPIFRQILESTRTEEPKTSESSEPILNLEASHASLREANDTGNIPDIYLYNNFRKPTNFNKTCARFPQLLDLKFRSDYWQLQRTTNGTFQLFNAYVDDRNGSKIRILGMYDELRPKTRFYCQLWFTGSNKPVISQTEELYWLFREKWGADRLDFIQPYLISCPYPNATGIPDSVSVVEDPCHNPSNNLKVFYKEVEDKKNFVVCVKGLDFPYEDKSARLTEWIELLNILGAEKIHFYEFSVHPTTKRVLDYYVDQGKIEVTPLTLAGDVSNHPYLQHQYLHKKQIERRLQEVIPYNDCLYKHLQEFKYVVLLDTDEVIVPAEGTWLELIETLKEKGGASFMARNVYFLDSHQHQHEWFEGIPKYMHMLQHVNRAENYTKPGYFVKGFHDTNRVMALHNHFPFLCIKGCAHTAIDLSLAHLQHYRSDCVQGVKDCDDMKKNSVVDMRLWNYKEELIERVTKTFKDLNFIPR